MKVMSVFHLSHAFNICALLAIVFLSPLPLFSQSLKSDSNTVSVKFHQVINEGQLEFISESNDTCGGSQTIVARNPHSKARWEIESGTAKGGQKYIQWENSKDAYLRVNIFKAEGPIDAKDKIKMCNNYWKIIVIRRSTILLRDLKKECDMRPGYYAISVYDDVFHDNSNWVVVKVD